MSWKTKFFNGFKSFSIAKVRSKGLVDDVKIVVMVIIRINRINIYADCNKAPEYIFRVPNVNTTSLC